MNYDQPTVRTPAELTLPLRPKKAASETALSESFCFAAASAEAYPAAERDVLIAETRAFLSAFESEIWQPIGSTVSLPSSIAVLTTVFPTILDPNTESARTCGSDLPSAKRSPPEVSAPIARV